MGLGVESGIGFVTGVGSGLGENLQRYNGSSARLVDHGAVPNQFGALCKLEGRESLGEALLEGRHGSNDARLRLRGGPASRLRQIVDEHFSKPQLGGMVNVNVQTIGLNKQGGEGRPHVAAERVLEQMGEL